MYTHIYIQLTLTFILIQLTLTHTQNYTSNLHSCTHIHTQTTNMHTHFCSHAYQCALTHSYTNTFTVTLTQLHFLLTHSYMHIHTHIFTLTLMLTLTWLILPHTFPTPPHIEMHTHTLSQFSGEDLAGTRMGHVRTGFLSFHCMDCSGFLSLLYYFSCACLWFSSRDPQGFLPQNKNFAIVVHIRILHIKFTWTQQRFLLRWITLKTKWPNPKLPCLWLEVGGFDIRDWVFHKLKTLQASA